MSSDYAYGIGADEPMKTPSLENIDRFARQFDLTDVQKQTIINIFYRNDQSDETLRSANVTGIILQRKGRWVNQEAVYADFLCQEFDAGISDIAEGTTKRAYLSDSLVCTKMRISKKFKGKSSSSPFCCIFNYAGPTLRRNLRHEDWQRAVSQAEVGPNVHTRAKTCIQAETY